MTAVGPKWQHSVLWHHHENKVTWVRQRCMHATGREYQATHHDGSSHLMMTLKTYGRRLAKLLAQQLQRRVVIRGLPCKCDFCCSLHYSLEVSMDGPSPAGKPDAPHEHDHSCICHAHLPSVKGLKLPAESHSTRCPAWQRSQAERAVHVLPQYPLVINLSAQGALSQPDMCDLIRTFLSPRRTLAMSCR